MAAQVWYGDPAEIRVAPLRRWLKAAGTDLWDFRSIRRSPKRTGGSGE